MLLMYLPGHAQVQDTTGVIMDAPQEAQKKYHISGTVKDKATGDPVEFATIAFIGTEVGTPADPDGNFDLVVTELPGDTIVIRALGYKPVKKVLKRDQYEVGLYITLESATKKLNEIVLRAGEDPAITLLKKVLQRKKYNNPQRFDNYRYEAYNKVEIDILNMTKENFENLPIPYIKNLSYIYNNLDSTSEEKPFLPFYLTETISDYYYQQEPKRTKEYIKASQLKGATNPNINRTLTQYLGNMYLAINPYDNYLMFFAKQYVSPLNNAGPTFYKYRIVDTQKINGHRIITMSFKPERPGENCFEGLIKIVDSVYAVQHIEAQVPKEANLNWLKNASFYKHYEPVSDSVWFCVKENITADLIINGDLIKFPGLKARKTNIYRDIKINDAYTDEVIKSRKYKTDVVIADTAQITDENFWANARPEQLSKNEQSIYHMIDTIQQDPKFRKLKNLVKFLGTGGVKVGWFEFGPYWALYSNNLIEGNRFRFSMGTTTKFSKDVYLNGYVAYGTKDETFKYNFNALWLLHNQFPRTYIAGSYTRDLDRTLNYYDKVSFDNFITVAIRKPGITPKFMFADDKRVEFYKEYYSGFSHYFTALHKVYDPYAPLPDVTIFADESGAPANTITQTEVNLQLRYAYKERFVNGNYYRTSLGSKYPIVDVRIAQGLKGILNGSYEYTKIRASVSDNIKVAPVGTIYLNVFAGQVFGTLPYPLLEIHPGNENYYFNRYAFNMMNLYEFISDKYVGFNIEHSLGNGFFNYIPLIKKLKFRQFWTAKGVLGSLNDANTTLNMNKGFAFKSLGGEPYIEVGTGIENILKLLRVDFIWRLTPKALPTEPRSKYFGIFGSVKFTF